RLQNPIVDQGLRNQQQVLGQNNNQQGTGAVLEQPQTTGGILPFGARVSTKNGGGAGSGSSSNFTVSAEDKGGSFENALVSTQITDKRTNMDDPIKKNLQDLEKLARLSSTNFNGAVSTDNNID